MPFAEHLLEQAEHLARRETNRPRQASLRRAVSTAYAVVGGFVQLQERRHVADYDNSVRWTRIDVLTQISKVAAAFRSWKAIRNEDLAQDFLIYLLVKDR